MAEAKKSTKKVEKQETQDGINQENSPVTTETNQQEQEIAKETTAKAGKRSAKAVAEVKAKEAKEERKTHQAEVEASEEKKPVIKKSRTRLERAGKKFRKAAELVEKDKQYALKEALELATKTSPVKFDATVELHINLGVDPRQADQNVRDNLVLPNGTGKTVRVAVLADTDDAAAAKKAGADIAGHEDLLKEIEKGVIAFDILIATPAMMPKLGKYARTLGPKGLMPNPKSGTVTTDVTKAVSQAKAGRVEYRVDSTGIVHLGVGKVSFGTDKLLENTQAVVASVKSNKPASIKGIYVKNVTISTTMGPGIKVELSSL
jgi:large subunit ribosomal protein L1